MYRIDLKTIKKEDINELDPDINFSLLEKMKLESGLSEIILNEKFEIIMLRFEGSTKWEIHPEFIKKIDKSTISVNGLKKRNEKKREEEFVAPSLDELLDKISKNGIDSLTKLERKALDSYGK